MSQAYVSAPRARVRARGVVQGVGFRPFVYAIAKRHGLVGWVRNDEAGVVLEVQGEAIAPFVAAMRRELPPLARLEALEIDPVDAVPGESSFAILESARAATVSTSIVPDAAPCRACLSELFDPDDRHHRYPFLSCTHCGPRFTITRGLPYDRARTSMAGFSLCADCAREYDDPSHRRFHAQPIACPACGPNLSMPIEDIVARLRDGEIVAVKGAGGFHIACDATNASSVARLRKAKERGGKPFAIMVAGVAAARRLVKLGAEEIRQLSGPARPVVLARRRGGMNWLAPAIAPDLAWLGVALPSTPLQYLLFHEAHGRPSGLAWLDDPDGLVLVMTSANPGGEPLVVDDAEAARRLAGLCDAIVGHDRAIVARCDDPVVRVIGGAPVVVRRGRGMVPEGIPLPRGGPSVLATGGFLKNAVCVTRGDRAYLSQHVGDLDDAETHAFFRETIAHLCEILEVTPTAVAHDLHPDFLSTRWAEESGLPCVPVQHHHAHLAAVLAEHDREGPHLGLALDGVGLGTDGGAWGGELLRVDGATFERVGRLASLPLPGGDAAAREPWRMAAAALHRLGRGEELGRRWGERGEALASLLRSDAAMPTTSGCGRWFDAACGLLGVRERTTYEGEAPMVLESLVREPHVLEGAWTIRDGELDLLPLLAAIAGMDAREGAEAFHGTLAAGLIALAMPALAAEGASSIALAGGCIVNATLTSALSEGFARRGIAVLLPRRAPAGDGGLALGQAWVAMQARGG